MKIVITIIGKDRGGIIATFSAILAENNVNIVSINQNIMDGFFNMVMLAEASDDKIKLAGLQKIMKEKGEEMSLEVKVQHADIFTAMHRI